MASTRLTNSIRDSLLKKLLERAFKARCDEFLKRAAAFAVAVHADVFGKDLEKMNALPKGWLPQDDGIMVRFGGDNTRLSFKGSLGSGGIPDAFRRCGSTGGDSVYLRLTDSTKGTTAKVYNAREPLAAEYEGLINERKDLCDEIERAARTAKAAMESCSTIEKLIKVWPEVEEFAKEFLVDGERKALLPDVPRAQLNNLLNLPPEEKAA